MENENKFFAIGLDDIQTDGMFVSDAFDSACEGNIWHRADITTDVGVCVSFYVSDRGETPDDSMWSEWYQNPADILLHGFKGRYLRVRFKLDAWPQLFRMRIHLTAHSFARYLPECYHDAGMDSFLVRFLAIFQSIYLDMERKITEIPGLLDPKATDRQRRRLLANWLSCDEFRLLPETRQGEFLTECVRFYDKLGTRAGMEEFFERFCGERPVIVEYFQIEAYPDQKTLIRHYGDDRYRFTVIFKSVDDMDFVESMIDRMKPAHTCYKAVALKKEFRLDDYTYLGVNSVCNNGPGTHERVDG